MIEQTIPQREKEQQGVVVWDQRGLVVRWSDGHSQRFSWDTLRHISLCTACESQTVREDTVFKRFP